SDVCSSDLSSINAPISSREDFISSPDSFGYQTISMTSLSLDELLPFLPSTAFPHATNKADNSNIVVSKLNFFNISLHLPIMFIFSPLTCTSSRNFLDTQPTL